MKIRLIVILFFFYLKNMFCQCDINNALVVNIDSIDCCNKLTELEKGLALSDTTTYMYLYYQLICEKTTNSEKYNQLIDSFYIIDERLKYSGTKSGNWKFRSNQRKKIRLAKRRILEVGYNKSLENEDFLIASDYAKKLKQCFPYWGDNKIKREWEYRELIHYEKYAKSNIVKLIDYHSNWLFRDTTRMFVRNPPFSGYNHLLNTVSTQYGKEEFRSLLEESIAKSRLIKDFTRGRPKYKLTFQIENETFELYDEKISILYYPDTILIDTLEIWTCYGENASHYPKIEIRPDTIKQAIPNPNNLENYKARFRRTLLYNIIDKLNN